MSDIIDIIDGLHAKATKGPVYRSEPSGIIDSSRGVFIAGGTWPHEGALLVELYNAWPALSARLREAEKIKSQFNGFMAALKKEPTTEELAAIEAVAISDRKAKAFDAIASSTVSIFRHVVFATKEVGWEAYRLDSPTSINRSPDLLTAVEAAIAAKETDQ